MTGGRKHDVDYLNIFDYWDRNYSNLLKFALKMEQKDYSNYSNYSLITLKMVNVFMTITMIPFLIPFYYAISYGMYIFAGLIFLSGSSSAFYHLFESQKHRLVGAIPSSRFSSAHWNYILINADRLFAFLLMCHSFCLLMVFYQYHWIELFHDFGLICVIAVGCMSISETVYRDQTISYMILHSIWHLLAAYLLNMTVHKCGEVLMFV